MKTARLASSTPEELRRQAALARALLDEIERLVPAGDAIRMNLADELARLGRRCIEAADALAGARDGEGV